MITLMLRLLRLHLADVVVVVPDYLDEPLAMARMD
jgi:hypothetical protein